MERTAIHLLRKIKQLGASLNKVELQGAIMADYGASRGEYARYSPGYYLTRFGKDYDSLIQDGVISERLGLIRISPAYDTLLDELPPDVSSLPISEILVNSLRDGKALFLETLRLVEEGSLHAESDLEGAGWSKNAIQASLSDLLACNLVFSAPLRLRDQIRVEEVTFIRNNRREIMKLALEKSKEAQLLKLSLPKIRNSSPEKIIVQFAEYCRGQRIEVSSCGLDELQLVFDQKCYDVRRVKGEIGALPLLMHDMTIIVCDSVSSTFSNEFWEEKNDLSRDKFAIYSLGNLEMFRACDDPLLELFESFIESIVPGSTLDASRALSSASVVVKKMRLRLEAREALQDRGEEGFVYTIPGLPWKLGSKIEDLLKLARNQVYVSNPFIDDTTFALLRSVPSHAKILLLTTDDPYLKGKIDRRELTQVAAKTFSTGQTVEFRELEDLHARFLLVDNKCALFLSTDLKTGSISDKFQYVYFTTSPEIVKSCAAYFDSMWTSAQEYDLLGKIGERPLK